MIFCCRYGYRYYPVKNFWIWVGYGIDNTRQIPANAGSDTGIQRSGTRIHKCGMLALPPLWAAALAPCRVVDFRALDLVANSLKPCSKPGSVKHSCWPPILPTLGPSSECRLVAASSAGPLSSLHSPARRQTPVSLHSLTPSWEAHNLRLSSTQHRVDDLPALGHSPAHRKPPWSLYSL
jgi:hypothetical protein